MSKEKDSLIKLGYKIGKPLCKGQYATWDKDNLAYITVEVICQCGKVETMFGSYGIMKNPAKTFIKWGGFSDSILKNHNHPKDEIKEIRKEIKLLQSNIN